MDDNYYNEVLPRWQFWKEYLVFQAEKYAGSFCDKEDLMSYGVSAEAVEKIKEINAEMIEKVKKVKSKTDLEKITDEFSGWAEKVSELCRHRDHVRTGCYLSGVINSERLSGLLGLNDFYQKMK